MATQTVFTPRSGVLVLDENGRRATAEGVTGFYRSALASHPILNAEGTKKAYFEFVFSELTSSNEGGVGIATLNPGDGTLSTNIYATYWASGTLTINGSNVATLASYAVNDVIRIAVDVENKKIWLAKNGVWQTYEPSETGYSFTGSASAIYAHARVMTRGAANYTRVRLLSNAGSLNYAVPSGFAPYFNSHPGEISDIVLRNDLAEFTGYGFLLPNQRVATIGATEEGDSSDISAVYEMKWKADILVTGRSDSGGINASFFPYIGPGFLNATEGKDLAADGDTTGPWFGAITYDVEGTIPATEGGDVGAFVGLIPFADDVFIFDSLGWTDELTSSGETGLITTFFFRDEISYSIDVDQEFVLRYEDNLLGALSASTTASDTLRFADSIRASFSADISDTLGFSDALLAEIAEAIQTSIGVTDLLQSTLVASAPALVDTLFATDGLGAGLFATVSDTLVVTDSIDSTFSSDVGLSDVIRTTDVLSGTLALTGVLATGVSVSDSLGSIWLVSISDTLGVASTLAGTAAFAAPWLSEAVGYTDTLAGSAAAFAPALTDAVGVSSLLQGALSVSDGLSDSLVWVDVLTDAAGGGQTIFVTNAETGATSFYRIPHRVTGVTSFNGVLYVSSEEGLFALDTPTDATVAWRVDTGFSSLGSEMLKRVDSVNLQARCAHPVALDVTVNHREKQTFRYLLPVSPRDSYRDGVVKVGGGLKSVYWGFALEGRGEAEIDRALVLVEPLSRRR
jgi:hypothetical protein